MQLPKQNSLENVKSILVKKVRFYAYPHQPKQTLCTPMQCMPMLGTPKLCSPVLHIPSSCKSKYPWPHCVEHVSCVNYGNKPFVDDLNFCHSEFIVIFKDEFLMYIAQKTSFLIKIQKICGCWCPSCYDLAIIKILVHSRDIPPSLIMKSPILRQSKVPSC